MCKSLFNKHLNNILFPFCFRLCPTVSGEQISPAETTGINQAQIGRKIKFKLFYNNVLRVCFRDSGEDE